MSRRPILEASRDDLAAWFRAQGEPDYRGTQVWNWVFGKRASDFASMTDLPARVRAKLTREFSLFTSRVVLRRRATDETEKLVLEFPDGSRIECVLMRELNRRTVCISTQVGCGMGCVFCASGLEGVKRNLTSGEILEQVLQLDRLLDPEERISHVVVMGVGEPLANLDALLPALQSVGEQGGLGIGDRRITISTVGLPERIRQLADAGRQYHLAVSLHAPDDALRNTLVAANRKVGISAILDACQFFLRRTGRQVTFEYVLLAGINDTPEHARSLAQLLVRRKAHVNLIPYNPVSDLSYSTPASAVTRRFREILQLAGVSATVRKRKGARIDAACGQLRRTAPIESSLLAGSQH